MQWVQQTKYKIRTKPSHTELNVKQINRYWRFRCNEWDITRKKHELFENITRCSNQWNMSWTPCSTSTDPKGAADHLLNTDDLECWAQLWPFIRLLFYDSGENRNSWKIWDIFCSFFCFCGLDWLIYLCFHSRLLERVLFCPLLVWAVTCLCCFTSANQMRLYDKHNFSY